MTAHMQPKAILMSLLVTLFGVSMISTPITAAATDFVAIARQEYQRLGAPGGAQVLGTTNNSACSGTMCVDTSTFKTIWIRTDKLSARSDGAQAAVQYMRHEAAHLQIKALCGTVWPTAVGSYIASEVNTNAEKLTDAYAMKYNGMSSSYAAYTSKPGSFTGNYTSAAQAIHDKVPLACTIAGGIPGHNPIGTSDTVTAQYGQITVSGWAFDPDNPTGKAHIHVYIGANHNEGHNLGATNQARPDVAAAYPGVGNGHGYSATITTSLRGKQTVYIYAINMFGPGGNVLLGTKTIKIT